MGDMLWRADPRRHATLLSEWLVGGFLICWQNDVREADLCVALVGSGVGCVSVRYVSEQQSSALVFLRLGKESGLLATE
jgi:hypothetical protein